MCANISNNLGVFGSLSRVQTVIKESKCNINKWNNLIEGDGGGVGNGADLSILGNEWSL